MVHLFRTRAALPLPAARASLSPRRPPRLLCATRRPASPSLPAPTSALPLPPSRTGAPRRTHTATPPSTFRSAHPLLSPRHPPHPARWPCAAHHPSLSPSSSLSACSHTQRRAPRASPPPPPSSPMCSSPWLRAPTLRSPSPPPPPTLVLPPRSAACTRALTGGACAAHAWVVGTLGAAKRDRTVSPSHRILPSPTCHPTSPSHRPPRSTSDSAQATAAGLRRCHSQCTPVDAPRAPLASAAAPRCGSGRSRLMREEQDTAASPAGLGEGRRARRAWPATPTSVPRSKPQPPTPPQPARRRRRSRCCRHHAVATAPPPPRRRHRAAHDAANRLGRAHGHGTCGTRRHGRRTRRVTAAASISTSRPRTQLPRSAFAGAAGLAAAQTCGARCHVPGRAPPRRHGPSPWRRVAARATGDPHALLRRQPPEQLSPQRSLRLLPAAGRRPLPSHARRHVVLHLVPARHAPHRSSTCTPIDVGEHRGVATATAGAQARGERRSRRSAGWAGATRRRHAGTSLTATLSAPARPPLGATPTAGACRHARWARARRRSPRS